MIKCRNRRTVGAMGLAAAVLLVLLEVRSEAQEPTNMSAIELRTGVIVDRDREQLYLMGPQGGIHAVSLEGGKPVWRTDAAAKPLGVSEDVLISQAERPDAGNAMNIVILDRATGEQLRSTAVPLPDGVKPLIREAPGVEFVARARTVDGDAQVSWQYLERSRKGVPPGVADTLQPADAQPAAAAAVRGRELRTGAFRIDLKSGDTTLLDAPPAGLSNVPRTPRLPQAERLNDLPSTQFLSADGRHVLVTQRTGDSRTWSKYTLTFYKRDSKERLGEMRSHVSVAPFLVWNSNVIYVTEPYSRRADNQVIQEPLKVRAVNLESGEELWTQQIRETEYRGPLPP